jgi:hypothetical protein
MAQTIQRGLRGNVLTTYAYCAGQQETDRRGARIEAGQSGRNGAPVWEPRVKPVAKKTSKVKRTT